MMKRVKILLLVFLLVSRAVCSYAQDGWIIEADDFSTYYGITSANGTIGMVSSPEPLKCSMVVLADAYDRFGRGRVLNFLPETNPVEAEISIDGKVVRAKDARDYVQRMDLRTGTFSGELSFRDHRIEYSYKALRNLPHAVMMEVTVRAGSDCKIRIDNIHSVPASMRDASLTSRSLVFHHKEGTRLDLMTTAASSPTGRVRTVASSAFIGLESPAHLPYDEDSHRNRVEVSLEKGKTLSFCIVGALISSAHTADPLNQAERIVTYACLQGKEELERRHENAWRKLWMSDIAIEGDSKAQLEVRSMLYHLYAFNRMDGAFSPSPMGLSGLGYNGHVFWDSEMFMFPSLLVLHPEMAHSMLQYRFERLEQARKNAASYGYAGVMFPWESADAGSEECPVTSLSGTFQHHVTADVGIAAWNYWRVTGDLDWLQSVGWPLLRETAAFWASRVDYEDGEYHIRNVMCADEWALNVDDDAYTNAAASLNLRYACEAAAVLRKAGIPATAPAIWKTISEGLHFETFGDGITREHSSYAGAGIKQADVDLLAWPLCVVSGKQAMKNLEYYSGKVPQKNTPAMTQCMFSVICSRFGKAEDAACWFFDSYRPNLNPPFGVIAEFKGGTNPYFLTGAGGAIQSVLFGFAGLDITDRGLVQKNGVLPQGWTKLTVTTPVKTWTVNN